MQRLGMADIPENKIPAPSVRPASTNGMPGQHHNLGDSLTIIGLVVAVLTWILAPNFWAKSIGVLACTAALVYLSFRSHFVRTFGLRIKSLIAAVAVVVVAIFALAQLLPQWKQEHQTLQIDRQPQPVAKSTPLALSHLTSVPEQKKTQRPSVHSVTAQHIEVPPSLTSQASPTPPVTYEQKCENSACAQGQGSQATFNQYGAPKLMMTDAQIEAISNEMKRYKGAEISVFCSPLMSDVTEFRERLAFALGDAGAGMNVSGDCSEVFSAQIPEHPGVSFLVGANRQSEAQMLARIMVQLNLVKSPIQAEASSNNDALWVIIRPNQ